MLKISSSDIKILDQFKLKTHIFDVYKAKWNNETVVVKRTVPVSSGNLTELEVLDEARHPHIVELKAKIDDGKFQGAMVLEYLPQGDLREYLIKNNQAGASSHPQRETMMIGVLRGLLFLHTIDIIHRDIKPQNILISPMPDGTLSTKICDFGYARKVDPITQIYKSTATEPSGSLGYRAAELFILHDQCNHYTKQADILALGLVILQMGSDNMYYIPGDPVTLLSNEVNHIPPPIRKEVSDITRARFNLCWNIDPSKRPTAEDLLEDYMATSANNAAKNMTDSFLTTLFRKFW